MRFCDPLLCERQRLRRSDETRRDALRSRSDVDQTCRFKCILSLCSALLFALLCVCSLASERACLALIGGCRSRF